MQGHEEEGTNIFKDIGNFFRKGVSLIGNLVATEETIFRRVFQVLFSLSLFF